MTLSQTGTSRRARTGLVATVAAGLAAAGIATGPAALATPNPSCLAFDSLTQSTTTGVMSCDVPAGVTALTVTATGAGGGGGRGAWSSTGGNGAVTSTTLSVVPSETLTLEVGTGGARASGNVGGGGGGGWTAIKRGSTVLVVAGGGGGGGSLSAASSPAQTMSGGNGGTPVATAGLPAQPFNQFGDHIEAGGGGTASAGGASGGSSAQSGGAGSATAGGRGGEPCSGGGSFGGNGYQGGAAVAGCQNSGGGGGAGAFGGGGGGGSYGGFGGGGASGGGGSSTSTGTGTTYALASNGGGAGLAGGAGRIQLSAPAPTVSAISPATGSSAGSTTVTVTGANFGSGTTVTVGGQACTSVTVVSSTSLTCTTPAHAAGAVDVVVTSGGQSATLAGGYTYAVPVPGAPTGVVATAGASSVTVSWTAPVSGGAVQRYEVRTTQGQAVCTTTTTSCVLGAEAGKSYDVVVVAVGAAGSSSPATGTSGVVAGPVVPTSVPTSAPLTLTTDKGQITTAAAGQEIVVLGSGFAPYSTATIVIYSSPTVLGTVTTDGNGSFSKPVTVPRTLAAGSHNLVAAGVDPQGATHTMRMEVQVAALSGGTLANTGFSAGLPLGLGALLLAGGAGLLWVSRRTS